MYQKTLIWTLLGINFMFSVNCECPAGFTQRNSFCFNFHTEKANWQSANEICRQNGAMLIEMDTQEKIDNFKNLFSNEDNEFWIGATGYFTNWMNLYNGNFLRDQSCHHISEHSFYFKSNFSPSARNKDDCVNQCKQNGYFYAGYYNDGECHCGHRNFAERPYVADISMSQCLSSRTNVFHLFIVNGDFVRWRSGQPNDNQGYQECAFFQKDNSGVLSDEKCNKNKRYICDLPKEQCTNEADSSKTIRNDRCLLLSPHNGGITTYFQATNKCSGRNGRLFVPLVDTDYEDLVDLLNRGRHSEAWVGITRRKWIWSTSKKTMIENIWSTNTNWLTKFFRKKCMLTKKEQNNDLAWLTDDCEVNKSFACEFVEVITTQQTTTEDVATTKLSTEDASSTVTSFTQSSTVNYSMSTNYTLNYTITQNVTSENVTQNATLVNTTVIMTTPVQTTEERVSTAIQTTFKSPEPFSGNKDDEGNNVKLVVAIIASAIAVILIVTIVIIVIIKRRDKAQEEDWPEPIPTISSNGDSTLSNTNVIDTA
ncbi:DgyrCDS8707 [Dimorphilus gyrociliatus]|uniref:DgyrCDS8707 n=1 Tax=Dimorphilus gyrociliatus TaxID=2664684 RepID=A0A7I8VWF1_9ANNE|nr:DgyrCDS8707 [Dimorphilus gyrociliatus]